jgi:hypothetical protein
VTVTKLTSTDAFYVIDLPDAPVAAGIVRWAKKILIGGAEDLARSLTYSYAVLGRQVSGASAGINAEPDGRADAVAHFVDEVTPLVAAGTLLLDPGKGVEPDDLGPLAAVDARPTGRAALVDRLLAASVVGSVGAVRPLDGARVALEDIGRAADELTAAFIAAGAEIVARGADAQAAECDVVGVGWKAGAVDHESVARHAGRVVVPLAPLAVTTRAVATGRRNDVTILPDFVTTAGPLLGGFPPSGVDPTDADALVAATSRTVAEIVTAAAAHSDGPVMGACDAAESFLLSWRDDLPFGRPI